MKRERFKLVPAVYLILKKDDTILLSLRKNTGYSDGLYGLVAGHIDGGETATDGMLREAKEEIGIDIPKDSISLKVTMHRMASEFEGMDLFFVADRWSGEIKNCEPKKCAELTFFPLNNLPPNIIPYVKEAILASVEGRSYLECGWSDIEKQAALNFQEKKKDKIEPSAHAPRNNQDLTAVARALFNGDGLAGTGIVIKEYETALKELLDVKNCVAVSSGTAAIHSALHALGVGPGDEVMVPAIAAVMTALPVIELGATPVLSTVSKILLQ